MKNSKPKKNIYQTEYQTAGFFFWSSLRGLCCWWLRWNNFANIFVEVLCLASVAGTKNLWFVLDMGVTYEESLV